jgi:hypothetical protein
MLYQGMIISPRTNINRANAQYSTGPKTEAGKQTSSLNALRHGLTGQIVVIPTDDPQAYQAHLESFKKEYDPQGATESNMVQALADASWRLNRIAALETDALGLAIESRFKALGILSMHSQRLSRQFGKTVTELHQLQKTRRAKEQRELSDLLDIIEMKGETYDPQADGFVFSPAQIESARRARVRENLALDAFELANE